MEHSKSKRTPGYSNSEKDKLRKDNDFAENTKSISHFVKAGEHFSQASKYCYQAARSHDEGNHQEANEYALLALGHTKLALRYQDEEVIRMIEPND